MEEKELITKLVTDYKIILGLALIIVSIGAFLLIRIEALSKLFDFSLIEAVEYCGDYLHSTWCQGVIGLGIAVLIPLVLGVLIITGIAENLVKKT